MEIEDIQKEIEACADPKQAAILARFFKTGPGGYGEGDTFRGVKVPVLREIADRCQALPLRSAARLLRSPVHEERFVALQILIGIFNRSGSADRKTIFDLYLKSTDYINNWDLVDASAEYIAGAYLQDRSRRPLEILAASPDVWKRRIAVMATFRYIKNGEHFETLKLAKVLLEDKHDLIRKAVGWMLREIGNRHLPTEEAFLKKHYRDMPRTMLRYAIEKFPEEKRQLYLKGAL